MTNRDYVEYRVRPITRYIVTRYKGVVHADGSESCGVSTNAGGAEYQNEETAYAVGCALAKAEADRLGYGLDDPRVTWPEPIGSEGAIEAP